MEFKNLVDRRRSMRRFDEEKTTQADEIKDCLELALLAPNSSNLQTWEFVRVRNKDLKLAMVPLCMGQGAARTADELVVFVTRTDLWQQRAKWNVAKINESTPEKDKASKLYKRAIQYYTKIIPLFYSQRPPFLRTLIRRMATLYQDLQGKPMMRFITPADRRVVGHKSTALAAQTFMYAMVEKGMATCPMEGFDSKRVKKLLNLPKSAEITMIVACGYGTKEGISNPRWRLQYQDVVKELF